MLNITPLGNTDWRNQHQPFGIKDEDRLRHIYAIGKTGTGKSTLLMSMAISDLERGNGLCVIDPHGDIAEQLLNYIPQHRIPDVIYFNATDLEYPIGFNPLANVPAEERNYVVSALIGTFKKIWSESWGPRLEHVLRFSLHTILYSQRPTLLDTQPLLTNAYFRQTVLNHVSDFAIHNFWLSEFEKYPPAFKSEVIAPILNKIGVFLSSLPLRNIVGQQGCSFKMQDVMDNRKILICNLAKGVIGEEASSLIGAMILTAIQSAAISRASYDQEKRIPFYVYVDEMHSFVTLSFADILAEARKYGLSLFLTHQYTQQLSETIRAAIFGNVGTLIAFRVGAEDAITLAKEFYPVFREDDLVHLPKFSMYLKLMIDGATSKPFSAKTLPVPVPTESFTEEIIARARGHYARKRNEVEQEISNTYEKRHKEPSAATLFE